ncbi:MAG: LacI family DNA-binding transcriptional regulator [Caldilineaceae bacterium]|nr:LacI family DNA-binding transcriptional regulator [Caldilineaceae bacterium]
MARRRKTGDTNRKTTIYDIAQLAGASASTVSAVLNGTWKERRIREDTATMIEKVAAEHGYSPNLQARGLRRARSEMVGMIVPVHDNRFFASLSQSFEACARERGWCPVVTSTLRDPEEEIRVVRTMISYAVDFLFIAGATNPDALGELCTAANLPHVFVDLPGKDAPSVVSDNYHGAEALSRTILQAITPCNGNPRDRIYFFGGNASDYATAQRIAAFRSAVTASCGKVREEQVVTFGYSPGSAAREIEALCDRIGGLPRGLLVNSLTAFEGVVSHFVHLPVEAFEDSVVGCFDYDPFAMFLQFPVHMVRQNSDELITTAYDLMDRGVTDPVIIEVAADLIPPRTIHKGRHSELG